MKILKQLWQIFKGEEEPSGWIMQQAKWDPEKKLYIVGDMTSTRNVNDPTQRTIDDGPIPDGWHQCFYYYEIKNDVTGGVGWRRCHGLAGPGLKPSFCAMHKAQEEQIVRYQSEEGQYTYCRWGSCFVKLFDGNEYCTEHRTMGDIKDAWVDEEECGCYGYCEKHFNNGQPRSQEDIEWDAIKEDVDWNYCHKIGWGQIVYRKSRKSIPLQSQETVHFKLEMRGSRDEVDLFHAILALCDSDYPLDPFRKNTAIPEKCDNCGGYLWKNAIVTPVDIKKAAKQANITVKVRTYLPESSCKKKDRVATA